MVPLPNLAHKELTVIWTITYWTRWDYQGVIIFSVMLHIKADTKPALVNDTHNHCNVVFTMSNHTYFNNAMMFDRCPNMPYTAIIVLMFLGTLYLLILQPTAPGAQNWITEH